MSAPVISKSDEHLIHESMGWGVEAIVLPDGSLYVQRYHLGTLPVAQRMMDSTEMASCRLAIRREYEERAGQLCQYLTTLAAEQGCHKVTLRTPVAHISYFVAHGLSVEALIDGYFSGVEDAAWLGLAVSEGEGATTGWTAPMEGAEGPEEAFTVVVHDRECAAEVTCRDWADPEEVLAELERQELRLAEAGVHTLVVQVPSAHPDGADALRRSGYRYRGALPGQWRGPDGPEGMEVWVRSTLDLSR